MAQRLNIPGNRSVATIDSNRDKHFKQFQQLGRIPDDYTSWDAVEEKFLDLTVREGLSDAEAAKRMGIDYKNVIQSGVLKLETSKTTGKVRGLNMRALREDIKPDEAAYINKKYGTDFLKDFQRLRELEWGDKKPRKEEDVEALKNRVYDALDGGKYTRSPNDPDFESAKTQADRARDRLANAFGKNGQNSQVHRGHGVSALEGAGVGASNLVDEWGPLNSGHGSAPRFDKRVMRALNMSAGDLQSLYDGYLKHRGLDINPVRYSGNYVSADESLRELNSKGSDITVPVESTRVSQDSIEWRDRRLFEMEQQISAEYERNGASPEEAKKLARAKLQDLSYSQSTLFDTTQTTGGDVTVIPGKPTQKVTVQPPGLIETDEFGRPLSKPKPPKARTVTLNAGLGPDAYEFLKANWRGAAMGAGLTLANPDTVKDIASGNLGSAAQRAAQDTAIGVAGEQVAGLAAQGLAKVAPQAAAQILPRVANLAASATPAGLTLLAAQGIQAVNDARVEAEARSRGTTAEQLRQTWRREDTGASRQALGTASRRYRAGTRKPPAAPTPLITVNGKPLDIPNELEYAGKQILKIFGIGK